MFPKNALSPIKTFSFSRLTSPVAGSWSSRSCSYLYYLRTVGCGEACASSGKAVGLATWLPGAYMGTQDARGGTHYTDTK